MMGTGIDSSAHFCFWSHAVEGFVHFSIIVIIITTGQKIT